MPLPDLKNDPTLQRSKEKVEFVREEIRRGGEKIVIRAEFNVGLGWNDGTALFYKNLGWRSAAEYDAAKHQERVDAEKAELAKLEAEKKPVKAEAKK